MKDWNRIEELYHAVMQEEEGERERFLQGLREEDEDVVREVRALMEKQREASLFLEIPALEVEASRLADSINKDTSLGPESTQPPAPPDNPILGKQLGHYKVLREIGRGGMGEVYLAKDYSLERRVALKLLPDRFREDAVARTRFVREAKSAAALDHPFICSIHEVLQTDQGDDCIVMEYVEGDTLRQRLSAGPLSVHETLRICSEVLEALETAHEHGIVHRDLKPANIMTTRSGHTKVMDFGLAKRLQTSGGEEEPSSVLTGEGTTLGTLAYMSPEQLNADPVDHRSDLFSLGVVLYELLTGNHPFRKDTQTETCYAILSHDPTPLSQILKDAPLELDSTIQKMLSKNPKKRYQTAEQVRRALEGIAVTDRVGKRSWSRIAPVGALTLSVMFLAIAVGWWHLASSSESEAVQFQPVTLTSFVGQEREPALSPDGSKVAFVWDGENQNNFDIYVMLVGSGEPLRLTTHSGRDYSPAWSPDGDTIAFLRTLKDQKASLFLIPALGGRERERAVVHSAVHPEDWNHGKYITWHPDGHSLFICHKDSEDDPWAVFLLSLDTGDMERLTSPPDGYVGDLSPTIDSNERFLAFTRLPELMVGGDLFTLELSEVSSVVAEPTRLTSLEQKVSNPAWTRNGKYVVFRNREVSELHRVNVARTGIAEPIAGLRGDFPATASNSDRLVYAVSSKETNIWMHHLERAEPRQRVVASTRTDFAPALSDNAESIAFVSTRSGHAEIWICDSDGSNAVKLTNFEGPWVGSPRWSPDARSVIFDCRVEGQSDIYSIAAGGGTPVRLTANPAQDEEPVWSRDGQHIYFTSDRGGSKQIWRQPAGNGEAVQITKGGGSSGQLSLDGTTLFYKREDRLWSKALPDGEESRILEQPLMVGPSFVIIENGVYFVPKRANGEQGRIAFYDFSSSEVAIVTTIERPLNWGLSASLDGLQILFPQVDYTHSDLFMVENFR